MSRKPYKRRVTTPAKKQEDIKVDIIEEVEQIEIPMPVEDAPFEAAAPQVEEEVIIEPEPEPEVEPELVPLYQVRIDHPSKRYRKEPSLASETVGLITDQGIYNVYEETTQWIKLDNGYWTMKEHTSKIKK